MNVPVMMGILLALAVAAFKLPSWKTMTDALRDEQKPLCPVIDLDKVRWERQWAKNFRQLKEMMQSNGQA